MAAVPRFSLLLVVFGVTGLASPFAAAQEPATWSDPLATKDIARAKFAMLPSDPRRLSQAKRDVARKEFDARLKEFLAGRGTLDILLEASQRWLESDLTLGERNADRMAARERHWELAWLIDRVNQARYEAGRIAIQDALQARYVRLEAELHLVQAAAMAGQPVGAAVPLWMLRDDRMLKELARAKAELVRADPAALLGAKRDAARRECEARFKEFLAGRGTLDILRGAVRRRLDSERALAGAGAAVAIERFWELTRTIETVNEGRHEAGRIPTKDWLESKAMRLEAEMLLLDARAKRGRPPALVGGTFGLPVVDDPVQSKELARAKREALHADRQELARARLAALARAYDSRSREFLAGRGTLDILLADARALLEAERTLLRDDAARRGVYERYWERTKQAEDIERARYEAGRIALQDLLLTQYARLEAEQWLLQPATRPHREPGP